MKHSDRKLDGAIFEEKVGVVSKLGIKVYPAKDLKSMKVRCRIDHGLPAETEQGPANPTNPGSGLVGPARCGIVSYAPPFWMKDRTFPCSFELPSRRATAKSTQTILQPERPGVGVLFD